MNIITILTIAVVVIPLLLVLYGYAFAYGVILAVERKFELLNKKLMKRYGSKKEETKVR